MRNGRPTSSAAIRTMRRCRSIISSGPRRGYRTIILDTGFDEAMGQKRNRQFLRSPADGLKAIGVNPDRQRRHPVALHYDHCGNHDMFPPRSITCRKSEMAYCTGSCMCHDGLRGPFEEEDVVAMVRKVFARRVTSTTATRGRQGHHGPSRRRPQQRAAICPRLYPRGWMVLASDASHFYANFETGRAYPIMHNHEATFAATKK